MAKLTTNANLPNLAANLSAKRKGSFVGLIIQKKGVQRGRGKERKTYGDDLVHVVLVTGFKYEHLVKRSLDKLPEINASVVLDRLQRRNLRAGTGEAITQDDVFLALESLAESFRKTLEGESISTTKHVYDPLVVNGRKVRGCRVYKCVSGSEHPCYCRECTDNPKSPEAGTIYLQGLKVWQRVLKPAEHGPIPPSKSRADVVAKNYIRKMLPIGRYVSYALEPGSFILS